MKRTLTTYMYDEKHKHKDARIFKSMHMWISNSTKSHSILGLGENPSQVFNWKHGTQLASIANGSWIHSWQHQMKYVPKKYYELPKPGCCLISCRVQT